MYYRIAITLFLLVSISLLAVGMASAERRSQRTKNIYGVKKDAIARSKTFGTTGKGIKENYFGQGVEGSDQARRQPGKNGQADAAPGPRGNEGGQAIPEGLIEQYGNRPERF